MLFASTSLQPHQDDQKTDLGTESSVEMPSTILSSAMLVKSLALKERVEGFV